MSKKLPFFIPLLFMLTFYNSCNQKGTEVKFQQYYAQGESLYVKHCSNCHQATGTGLGLLYPPLNTSDYLNKNSSDLFCLIKYGVKGEMLVNGKSYNQSMPGVRSLNELEIAEIATYLYNTWGRDKGIVEITEVRPALEKCE